MHHFMESIWEHGGKRGDELTLFLSYSETRWEPTDDNPLGAGDPAAWYDWPGLQLHFTSESERTLEGSRSQPYRTSCHP
jgi:hypothetical protein